jgi:hypothetical protein
MSNHFLKIKVIQEDYGKSAFFIKPKENYAEYIQLNVGEAVKSHKSDNTVKSFRCKVRESLGMRST